MNLLRLFNSNKMDLFYLKIRRCSSALILWNKNKRKVRKLKNLGFNKKICVVCLRKFYNFLNFNKPL